MVFSAFPLLLLYSAKRLVLASEDNSLFLYLSSSLLIVIYKKYFSYVSKECPGWLNIDDDLCVECGENNNEYNIYEICYKRKQRWNKFGGKYLNKGNIEEVRSHL